MVDKTNDENFLKHMPTFTVWHKALLTYFFQFLIFIFALIFFWWISSTFLLLAIFGQSIVSILLAFLYIYITNNAESIRKKYHSKYRDLAFQQFWYNYQSYALPFISAAFYFPLLLKTDYFLPVIVKLPPHHITNSLFPIYIALPLGILIIIFGALFTINRKKSGSYSVSEDNYLFMIYPEKGRLIKTAIYSYIRHPKYLGRGIIAVGFGVIANNFLAILVGGIHFLSFCVAIPIEDKELLRRFGADYKTYSKDVPALFPRYGKWKKFIRFILIGEKSS